MRFFCFILAFITLFFSNCCTKEKKNFTKTIGGAGIGGGRDGAGSNITINGGTVTATGGNGGAGIGGG